MQPFRRETSRYELEEGFWLEKAEEEPFIRAWISYRGRLDSPYRSPGDLRHNLADVPFLYWLKLADQAVAGMVMLPNAIGDLFLVPPMDDCDRVLSLILPLLKSWSDETRPIRAQMIADDFLPAFEANGFVVRETVRRMIRPVTAKSATLPPGFALEYLAEEHRPDLPAYLWAGFLGNPGAHGRRSVEQWQPSVDNFWQTFEPDSDLGRASMLVRDQKSNSVAALIICDRLDGLANVRFIATLGPYRRQGIAQTLLQLAMNEIAGSEDWVQLSVTIGNPAEKLYLDLGFQPCPLTHEMEYPSKK